MGNRFREFNGYHNLILAHGVMAALTFLLFVPSAIMLMRFKRHRPNAVRFHVWLQILTFLLATAIIILGFVAVGPERSLSNPHHGIGLALYVMIVLQFFGGAWIRHKERKKRASYGLLRILVSSCALGALYVAHMRHSYITGSDAQSPSLALRKWHWA